MQLNRRQYITNSKDTGHATEVRSTQLQTCSVLYHTAQKRLELTMVYFSTDLPNITVALLLPQT